MSVHEKSFVANAIVLNPRAESPKRLRHNVLTTCGMMAVFLGLVVLPQTRANIWMPSSAGDSSFLVGP